MPAPTGAPIASPRPATSPRPSWSTRTSARLGAFTMIMALVVGGSITQCAPPPAPSAQQQVIDLTNVRRAEAGFGPLTVNQTLVGVAQRHAEDQARLDTISHTGSDGSNPGTRIVRSGYPVRAWGENVASGYADAASVMAGWMASPGHRANLLNGRFVEVGIGLAYAPDGTPYWTMELGRPW